MSQAVRGRADTLDTPGSTNAIYGPIFIFDEI